MYNYIHINNSQSWVVNTALFCPISMCKRLDEASSIEKDPARTAQGSIRCDRATPKRNGNKVNKPLHPTKSKG